MSMPEQYEWYRKETSRRALLRGGLVGAGALVAGAAGLPGAANATPRTPALLTTPDRPAGKLVVPFGRHLSFGTDPTTQAAVAWQVASPVDRPFVRIGTSPYDLGERIDAEVRALTTHLSDTQPVDSVPPAAPATIEQYYLHAAIGHLRPGQTYYYRVGHAGWDGRDPAVHSFTTAPRDRRPFTFTAFGDQGISYDAVSTANLVRAQNPAFHLHAGDISYAEGTGHGLISDSYDPRVWDSFFTQVESVASTVPWQIASGNHEMEPWYSPDGNGGLLARFDFPQRKTYYSFTYGNVAVISLDANDVSYEIPANLGYTAGNQVSWLEHQLAAARRQPGIDFVVVYFHHCAYCTCTSHASDGGIREHWTPLFDKYGVDLVITGHNHIYERTDPIRRGTATGAAPIGTTVTAARQGTTYITAGGAGNSLYSFGASDSYAGHVDPVSEIASWVSGSGQTKVNETVTWSRVRYTGYCLLVLDSRPAPHGGTSTLTVRGLSGDGAEIDRVVLAAR